MTTPTHPLSGLYRLTRHQRLDHLVNTGYLTSAQRTLLVNSIHNDIVQQTDSMIENTIGCFPLPLGIATHVRIDQEEKLIPMAIEETSVVAALSHIGKWCQGKGEVITSQTSRHIVGQIHFPQLNNPDKFKACIQQHQTAWLARINQQMAHNMCQRGGGARSITCACFKQASLTDGCVYVKLDPCDSMGANLITQICEQLKPHIAAATQETAGIAIVSNHAPDSLTTATIALHAVSPSTGNGIVAASTLAKLDPYRAATHNKGILNAIDAVLIATGNDWRAVESGVHAFACQDGSYGPLSQWSFTEGVLVGTLTAPLHAATIGGVTALHPIAQLSLDILSPRNAAHLSRMLAGVGLLQNLAALKALSTQGLSSGHMRLHLSNLLTMADATADEKQHLYPILEAQTKTINLAQVKAALSAYRQQIEANTP